MTQSLPETYAKAYERGFKLGRMAGLEQACEVLRNMTYSPEIMKALETLTRAKYEQKL